MSNTITPTVFYRTLNVKGLEIFYREAGFDDRTIVIDNAPTAAGSPYEAWKWQLCAAAAQCVTKNKDCHITIETLLGDCDSNFMPVALFPRCCAKFGLCTRTYAQEIEKRSVKNNSSMHRNGGSCAAFQAQNPH